MGYKPRHTLDHSLVVIPDDSKIKFVKKKFKKKCNNFGKCTIERPFLLNFLYFRMLGKYDLEVVELYKNRIARIFPLIFLHFYNISKVIIFLAHK